MLDSGTSFMFTRSFDSIADSASFNLCKCSDSLDKGFEFIASSEFCAAFTSKSALLFGFMKPAFL